MNSYLLIFLQQQSIVELFLALFATSILTYILLVKKLKKRRTISSNQLTGLVVLTGVFIVLSFLVKDLVSTSLIPQACMALSAIAATQLAFPEIRIITKATIGGVSIEQIKESNQKSTNYIVASDIAGEAHKQLSAVLLNLDIELLDIQKNNTGKFIQFLEYMIEDWTTERDCTCNGFHITAFSDVQLKNHIKSISFNAEHTLSEKRLNEITQSIHDNEAYQFATNLFFIPVLIEQDGEFTQFLFTLKTSNNDIQLCEADAQAVTNFCLTTWLFLFK